VYRRQCNLLLVTLRCGRRQPGNLRACHLGVRLGTHWCLIGCHRRLRAIAGDCGTSVGGEHASSSIGDNWRLDGDDVDELAMSRWRV
jgi:hypothetical protein